MAKRKSSMSTLRPRYFMFCVTMSDCMAQDSAAAWGNAVLVPFISTGAQPSLASFQSLPLRHAYRHHARDQARLHRLGRFAMNAPLQLSRRDLLKGSSVLVVAFSIAPPMKPLPR